MLSVRCGAVWRGSLLVAGDVRRPFTAQQESSAAGDACLAAVHLRLRRPVGGCGSLGGRRSVAAPVPALEASAGTLEGPAS